jgi:hypothetical protein
MDPEQEIMDPEQEIMDPEQEIMEGTGIVSFRLERPKDSACCRSSSAASSRNLLSHNSHAFHSASSFRTSATLHSAASWQAHSSTSHTLHSSLSRHSLSSQFFHEASIVAWAAAASSAGKLVKSRGMMVVVMEDKEEWPDKSATCLYVQELESISIFPYTEASLCYADDQGWSLFKYPGDVMSHIWLTLETAFTG